MPDDYGIEEFMSGIGQQPKKTQPAKRKPAQKQADPYGVEDFMSTRPSPSGPQPSKRLAEASTSSPSSPKKTAAPPRPITQFGPGAERRLIEEAKTFERTPEQEGRLKKRDEIQAMPALRRAKYELGTAARQGVSQLVDTGQAISELANPAALSENLRGIKQGLIKAGSVITPQIVAPQVGAQADANLEVLQRERDARRIQEDPSYEQYLNKKRDIIERGEVSTAETPAGRLGLKVGRGVVQGAIGSAPQLLAGNVPGAVALTAAGSDYTRPQEAAVNIAGAALPVPAARAITPAAETAARALPKLAPAIRAGAPVVTGAGTNVASALALGETDPEKLAETGIVGGLMSGPDAYRGARAGRGFDRGTRAIQAERSATEPPFRPETRQSRGYSPTEITKLQGPPTRQVIPRVMDQAAYDTELARLKSPDGSPRERAAAIENLAAQDLFKADQAEFRQMNPAEQKAMLASLPADLAGAFQRRPVRLGGPNIPEGGSVEGLPAESYGQRVRRPGIGRPNIPEGSVAGLPKERYGTPRRGSGLGAPSVPEGSVEGLPREQYGQPRRKNSEIGRPNIPQPTGSFTPPSEGMYGARRKTEAPREPIGPPNVGAVAPTPETQPQLARGMYGNRPNPKSRQQIEREANSTNQIGEIPAENVPRRPLENVEPINIKSPIELPPSTLERQQPQLTPRQQKLLPAPRPEIPLYDEPLIFVERSTPQRPLVPESRPQQPVTPGKAPPFRERLSAEPMTDPAVTREIDRMRQMGPADLDQYVKNLEGSMADWTPRQKAQRDPVLREANKRRSQLVDEGQLPPKYNEPKAAGRLGKGDLIAEPGLTEAGKAERMGEKRTAADAARDARGRRRAKIVEAQNLPVVERPQQRMTPAEQASEKGRAGETTSLETPRPVAPEAPRTEPVRTQPGADQGGLRGTEGQGAKEAAPEGRKINHSRFGTVTETADQKGIQKGKLRIIQDSTGDEKIIQNPRTHGNREAAFVKSGPAPKPEPKPGDLVTWQEGRGISKGRLVEYDKQGRAVIDTADTGDRVRVPREKLGGQPQQGPLRVPENLRSKAIGRDISDEGKVSVKDLGLESKFAPSLPRRTKTTNKSIPIEDITLGRDDLSKGRMLQVERALSKGLDPKITQGNGIDAITVVADPQRPGKYVVNGDGNHRIALMKLAGFKGDVPVKATEPRGGRITVGPIPETKGGTVLGAGFGGLQSGFGRRSRRPPAAPPQRASLAQRMGAKPSAGQPQSAQAYFDSVLQKELQPQRSGTNTRLINQTHDVLRKAAIRADKGQISDAQAQGIVQAADQVMTAARLGDQKQIREAQIALRKAQNAGSLTRKVGSGIKAVTETSRTSVFGGDLSIPLRQAWPLVAGIQNWPQSVATAKNVMFKALMSEKGGQQVKDAILKHPSFDRAQNANLELTGLAEGEEIYGGNQRLEKIPVIGKIYARTQAANEAFLDWSRLEFFDREMKKLDKKQLSPNEKGRQEKAIAEAINTMTGRTDLGEGKFRDLMSGLQGTLMTSPRLNVSRLQMLNPQKYASLARQSPQAAKLMAQEAGSAAATIVGLGFLGSLAGAGRFITDRDDPDFGKFRSGKVAHDISGGLLPQVKLLLEIGDYGMAEGKNLFAHTKRTEKAIGQERKEMVNRAGSYFRTRETPLVGLAHDVIIKGKDFEGQPLTARDLAKPKVAAQAAYRAWGPAYIGDLVSGFRQGVGTGAQMIPGFFGGGETVITPKMERDRRKRAAERRKQGR